MRSRSMEGGVVFTAETTEHPSLPVFCSFSYEFLLLKQLKESCMWMSRCNICVALCMYFLLIYEFPTVGRCCIARWFRLILTIASRYIFSRTKQRDRWKLIVESDFGTKHMLSLRFTFWSGNQEVSENET